MFPCLLIIDLMFGKYSLLLWEQEFSYIHLRNFLFMGLPYFGLGACIKAKKIQSKSKCKQIVGGLFGVLSMVEFQFLT